MPRILALSEVQTLATAQRLNQHRGQSVAATRAALQRTIAERRVIEGKKRQAAYIASREAAALAETAHDRASATRICCARKVADCG